MADCIHSIPEPYGLLLAEGDLTRRVFGAILRRIWALPLSLGDVFNRYFHSGAHSYSGPELVVAGRPRAILTRLLAKLDAYMAAMLDFFDANAHKSVLPMCAAQLVADQ